MGHTDDRRNCELAPAKAVRRRFQRAAPHTWVRVGAAATKATIYVNGHKAATHLGAWTPFEIEITPWLEDENQLEIRCKDVVHTTNGFLPTIGIRWTGARDVEILTAPTPPVPPAPQRSAVDGTRLLVDGRPFRVRGLLHWGYYPELGHPWPTEEQMRREITDAQAMGFNLIKFCLWVPPPRYYELCDELGMLVWQEYPVWNAPLEDRAILDEYSDFFRLDGPHPCVILRTLTCENDRVDADLARELVGLAHEMIPGCLVLDNSSWLCAERIGDFHDEHPYLHNAQWRYYGQRMRGKLTKPLLLGETIAVDAPLDSPADLETALSVRRFQIETLARDLPDAGYVITGIRDLKNTPLGLFTSDGKPYELKKGTGSERDLAQSLEDTSRRGACPLFQPTAKYTPEQWSWHRDELAAPREIPEPLGPIIGPRNGQWKCPEYTWWSPVLEILDPTLPADLIRQECVFELLSGRVLACCDGTRVLVAVRDLHDGRNILHPLIIEFETEGRRRVVSAFRHDTPAGRKLWEILSARTGPASNIHPAPEIGPLVGTSIVLEDWEMSLDQKTWLPVKCDTPLANRGRNIFEGWATFRTIVDYPGGQRTLRCEAVGDYYEILINDKPFAEAGPRQGTWNGTRDVPRNFKVDLPPGEHEFLFRVRDWRAAGGMVGPVYLPTDPGERIF